MLRLLEIETPILKSSQMQAVGKSSDLILNLCKEAGASRYISGTGGMGYLEEAKFKDAGIKIVYQPPILPSKHPQVFPEVEFMNDLSALDILFNCGSSWRDYLPKGSWI